MRQHGRLCNAHVPATYIFGTKNTFHPNFPNPVDWYSNTNAGAASWASPVAAGVAALIWSTDLGLTRDQVAARLIATTDDIDEKNVLYEGLLGSGRVNSNRAVRETLPPPRIDRIMEIPHQVDVGMTQLTVDLANVFMTSTWSEVWNPDFERYDYSVDNLGPVDDPTNWELRRDVNLDGDFDDPVDTPITLTLDYTTVPGLPYSRLPGYKIGTNVLDFGFDPLAEGRYRFTAFADDPSNPDDNGLRDPFGTPLDGDGDGVGGDDYVREFYVSSDPPTYTLPFNITESLSISESAQRHGHLDITLDGVLIDNFPLTLMELAGITINEYDGGDFTVDIGYLGEDFGAHVAGGAQIQINPIDDAIAISVEGGPYDDLFTVDPGPDGSFGSADDVVSVDVYHADTLIDSPVDLDPEEIQNYQTTYILNYRVEADWTTDFTGIGGGGTDSATVLGNDQVDDTLVAYPGQATLTSGLSTIDLTDFDHLDITAGAGGTDTVHLSGSFGDDLLETGSTWADLSNTSQGWSNETTDFDAVHVHVSGGDDTFNPDPPLPSSNVELVGLFWDEQSDEDWSASSWLDWDGQPAGYPDDADTDAVISNDTVTFSGTGQARDLSVPSGTLAIDAAETLDVAGRFAISSTATYEPQLATSAQETLIAGLVDVTGDAHLAGKLWPQRCLHQDGDEPIVPADSPPATDPPWSAYTVPIIQAASVTGTFDITPAPHELAGHLGHGVFLTDQFTNGQTVTYDDGNVYLDLFQAAPGDTDGNRKVEGPDMFRWLGAGKYGTGEYADWTQGDFNGDHRFDSRDTFLMLGASLYGDGIYWPEEEAAAQGGGSAPLAAAQGGSTVELVLTPQGLMIDTHDVGINGYMIESELGILTGHQARNLGMFREDTDLRISGTFDYVLTGKHLVGKVIGDEFAAVDLSTDLTLSYTIEGQTGIYTATIVTTASAETLAWLADYDAGDDESTFSHGVDPDAVDRLLATL